MRGKKDQQNGNTTYIGGLAVLSFDEMSTERKIPRDKEQSEWEKPKNTKMQSVFLDAIENTKKIQEYEYKVFFGIYFVFLYFCEKYETNTKIRIRNLKNTKYQKKYKPKISKYKVQKNTNSKSPK